jgi:hypothetical protein
MKKILIYSLFFISTSPVFALYSPGTKIVMSRGASPSNAALANRNGGSWNNSIGDGGGVDYSTWDAPIPIGGLTTVGAGNVIASTSAAADWKGNGVFFTAGANMNLSSPWWQITKVTPGVDFTVNSATGLINNASTGAVTDGAMNLGGALSGGSASIPTQNNTFDAVIETLIASCTLLIYPGYYLESSVARDAGNFLTASTPAYVIGISTFQDPATPFGTSTSAPTIDLAANTYSGGSHIIYRNIKIIGTATTLFTASINTVLSNVKIEQNSTNAGRLAYGASVSAGGMSIINSEISASNGLGLSLSNASAFDYVIYGSYIHDCSTGAFSSGTGGEATFINNIFANNRYGVGSSATLPAAKVNLFNNTFIGFDAFKVSTLTVNVTSCSINMIGNSFSQSFSAFESRHIPFAQNVNYRNSYFNIVSTFSTNSVYNPNPLSNIYFDTKTAWGLDPQFVDVTELSGSTATTGGTQIFMHGGGMFSNGITDNVDFINLHYNNSSTSTAKIIGHSSFSVTTTGSFGTSTNADKKFTIRIGKNFNIGNNLKALNQFKIAGSSTTSYMDIGAAQREERGVSGGGSGAGSSHAYWR